MGPGQKSKIIPSPTYKIKKWKLNRGFVKKREPAVRHLWDVMICGSRRITGSWILWAPMKGIWWHLHVWSSNFLLSSSLTLFFFMFIIFELEVICCKREIDSGTARPFEPTFLRIRLFMALRSWAYILNIGIRDLTAVDELVFVKCLFPDNFLFILGILVLNFLGLNIIILSSSIGWNFQWIKFQS